MASVNTSSSERGVLINHRAQEVMIFVDPLNIGRRVPHRMTLDLYDLVDTESIAKAVLNGSVIEETSLHGDFYGLGTSRREILDMAIAMAKKYANTGIDVVVETTVAQRPVLINEEQESFYGGGVEVFRIPTNVFLPSDEAPYVGLPRDRTTFVIWKNGAVTQEGHSLDQLLEEFKDNDAAGSWRKPWR